MGRITGLSSHKQARRALASALILLLLVGVAASVSIVRLLRSERWVIHTHEVQAALGEMGSAMAKAARARTGYINTGDKDWVRAFKAALPEVDQKLRHLGELMQDNASQQELYHRLQDLTRQRVALFEKSIELKKTSPRDEQGHREIARQGLPLSSAMTDVTQQIRNEEQQLLVARVHVSARLLIFSAILLAFTFALALALLAIHYRLLSVELTARQRAEEEIRNQNVQLEAANRELETFSYSVSHDLRAPLRAIDGFSLALLEECGDKLGSEQRGYLHDVREATKRMGQLIKDLLELSRTSRCELTREKVDLSLLARDITSQLCHSEPERQATFVIAQNLVVDGDWVLLRTVLENLFGNAWKFTSKRPNAELELGVQEHGTQKIYFVRDNGVGFDMKHADKLFGPFQRLHDAREFPGTGVGLASVQRIIHRHGGRVWAEAVAGKEAIFYFSLA